MIVVDSSAIVAIFLKEQEAKHFAGRIADATSPILSAGSLLETSIVLRGQKKFAPRVTEIWLDEMLANFEIAIEPVTFNQVRIARLAQIAYGKGTGHPARLNFGDCFSYALARAKNVPLLFKGNDFTHTDIVSALG